MKRNNFDARDALVSALKSHLLNTIQHSIAERGKAVLALSGGSTPIPLYAELALEPLEWGKVCFALVDERWVDADHPASNETAIRSALAPALAAGAMLIGMKNSSANAHEGLPACLDAFDALPLPFDLVLLGMGEDGHTASWFPHAHGLEDALAQDAPRCAAVIAKPSKVTGDNTERMTLTLPAVASARDIVLLITGDSKRHVFEIAIKHPRNIFDMPVRALLADDAAPIEVWWSP